MSFFNGLRIALNPSASRWFDANHPEGPLVVAFTRFGPTTGSAMGRFLLGKSFVFRIGNEAYGEMFFGYQPNPDPPEDGEPLPQPIRVRTRIEETTPGNWLLSSATYWSYLVGAEGQMAVEVSLTNFTGPSLRDETPPRTATLTIRGNRQIPLHANGFDPGTQAMRFDGLLSYTAQTLDGDLSDVRTATDGTKYGNEKTVTGSI